jgi:hypothetical protein
VQADPDWKEHLKQSAAAGKPDFARKPVAGSDGIL